MSSKIFNTIIRIAGFIITVILVIQPWLIKLQSIDPFFISGWAIIFAAFLSLSAGSLLLAFYRPLKGYNTLTYILILCFIAISISLYFTHYTVCFRISMLQIGLLATIGSLFLLRRNTDNFSIAGMISLSGFLMAVYAICQSLGYDFLIWESKYSVVGTLTNPNFLGIFLCLTSAITFGLFSELYKKSFRDSLVFLFFFLTQIYVILLLNKPGHLLSLAFMVLIWIWSYFFNFSGKISRKSPLIAGFIIAVILFMGQWFIHTKISNYPWGKITKLPNSSQAFVSRLLLWQMGFAIFKEHPWTGTGAGSISYIMPLKRLPTASTLGLVINNDDPHSFIVTSLTETGFLGLWGICSLLTAIFGVYVRKNSKYESVEPISLKKGQEIHFPWLYISLAIFILYLAFKSGYINQNLLPAAISLIIIFFGISISALNNSHSSTKNDYYYIGKSTLTAILTFAFYSVFNNTFSLLPFTGFLVAITSLHFSCCLPDIAYKPRITLVSLLFLFLPVIYGFITSQFQLSYQQEQKYLNLGNEYFNNQKWEEAEQNFLSAINTNPQCLRAYHGRALALDKLGRSGEAQEVLNQLDTMVPNIFNVKYDIARILFNNHKILEAHRYAINNLKWIKNPLAYELYGNILLKEGKINEAEEVFKEGLINIPPKTNERESADRIRLSLAALATNRGDYATSKIYLKDIKSPEVNETLEALYMNGIILSQEKKYDESLEIFEKALKSYPTVPRVLNATGYLLMITNKDLDRAQIILEEAFNQLKNSNQRDLSDLLMIANSLGKVYKKQNKLDKAGELLKFSYEETPNEWKALKEERLKDLNDFYNSFKPAE
jgi:tetratricopeptide (TPR) repeat protein